jgi:hypothetical protein
VLMAFLLGFNKTKLINDLADINMVLGDIEILAWAIAQDQRSALVRGSDNQVHLILVLGDKHVARKIDQTALTPVAAGHIRIESTDLGFPALDFRAEPSTCERVINAQSKSQNP